MIPWSSTSTSCEGQLKKARQSSHIRTLFALTIPFFALALQFALWPIVQPFFWFAFYPAVFLSAWLGGFTSGLSSTILSTALCWYFFIPPERHFVKSDPKYLITMIFFFLMGFLVSVLNGKLRKIIKRQNQEWIETARKETQLQEAQRIGNFGSWTWDIKKNHIEWSNETYRIFGLQPHQFTATFESFLNCVHPQDRELVKKCVREALSEGKAYSIDHRIVLLDGTEKIVHEVADVYIGENGKSVEMIGTVHDITQRKKIEEVYKESESKFRGLLETACDPIIIVNIKGMIEFVNRQTKNVLGYEPEELLGKPVETLIPERFKATHVVQRTKYMEHPNPQPMGRNLQLVARKKDGSDLPVDISLSPFNTKNETIVTAFMRDMSEKKRHEAQQRFLFDTSRILSETMDYQESIQGIAKLVVPPLADCCLIHIFEQDHLVLKAFAQREAIESALVADVLGCAYPIRNDLQFGPGFVATQNSAQLIEVVDEKILIHMGFDGDGAFDKISKLNIQSWISVPMVARGRSIGVMSLIRCKPMSYTKEDLNIANLVAVRAAITVDNARLYKNAQDAIRLREDILAIVSHDLKNPLGVISGFNEIIADTLVEMKVDKANIEATEAIARSVRQMERLIGDLLDFAKIESSTLGIESKPNRVDQLIGDGIESVHHHLERKAIQVKTEIQPELLEIFCDSDRIRRVFSNLLGNAVKFSPARGSILIRAKLKEAEVVFSVSDNGPGIAPENLKHLFDRYWQAKETAKQGTGLGLSIAKGIVEGHHGRIWAESEIGKGATIYFSLPIGKTAHHPEMWRGGTSV